MGGKWVGGFSFSGIDVVSSWRACPTSEDSTGLGTKVATVGTRKIIAFLCQYSLYARTHRYVRTDTTLAPLLTVFLVTCPTSVPFVTWSFVHCSISLGDVLHRSTALLPPPFASSLSLPSLHLHTRWMRCGLTGVWGHMTVQPTSQLEVRDSSRRVRCRPF